MRHRGTRRLGAACAALSLLLACGADHSARSRPVLPVAAEAPPAALAELRRLLAAQLGRHEADRLLRLAGTDAGPAPAWLRDPLLRAARAGAPLDGGRIAPLAPGAAPPGPAIFADRWRLAHAFVHLDADGPLDPSRPFPVPGLQATGSVVVLRSLAEAALRIAGTCDGPARLRRSGETAEWRAGTPFAFTLAPGERDRTALELDPATAACDLTLAAGRHGAPHPFRLAREEGADPALDAADSRFDVCRAPAPDPEDPLAAAFHASRWLSQTCAAPVEQALLLPDARDAFNAKAEALLGAPLPDWVFERGDPTVPLDVSRAPRLDLIVLSYLDLKADFSGALIARMLRHHAARGTTIRILVAGALENDKDRALIEGLAADFPNIQVQLYAWDPGPWPPVEARIDAIHRTHHVKLFLTLSPDPGASRAILGGRNIHDGFLFDRALDLTAYPDLQNYGDPGEFDLNYFATYSDFEVAFRDEAWVRTLAAHFATVWHRDAATNVARPFSVTTTDPRLPADSPGMRHFVSVPYLDGRALERLYVELIDAATDSVEIVSPYLNPTPAIEAALLRARARGVAVRVVARIRLYGDLGGRLMTELNMLFVERHAGRFEILEYLPEAVVLHTKLLVVDGRLALVTSANLNRRSFYHDTENGVMVLDPAFAARIRAVIDAYRAEAEPATPSSYPVRPAARRLLTMPELRDLF